MAVYKHRVHEIALPETNSSPLKMDGWNTILSYWFSAYFQGLLLLVSGRVPIFWVDQTIHMYGDVEGFP